jgi:hypothetical protein
MYCWGLVFDNQSTGTFKPTQLPTPFGISKVACGEHHTSILARKLIATNSSNFCSQWRHLYLGSGDTKERTHKISYTLSDTSCCGR